MVKTYKEPGKARKQCPSCNLYVHARSLLCDCGHVFGKSINEPRVPVVADKPSRGKKLCKCGKYIGARSIICPNCTNMEFDKTEKSNKIDDTPIGAYAGSLIYTPSGVCPKNLNQFDRDGVFNWCRSVYLEGLKINKTYTKNALKYWFNNFNRKDLKVYIDEWAAIEGFEKGEAIESGNEESS